MPQRHEKVTCALPVHPGPYEEKLQTCLPSKRRGWVGLRRMQLNVGGVKFMTTLQTLGSMGPSFFDAFWGDEFDDAEVFIDHSPKSFEILYCALLQAREHDLTGALLTLRSGLLGEHSVFLKALIKFLMLEWVIGSSWPMSDDVRRLPAEGRAASTGKLQTQDRDAQEEKFMETLRGEGVLMHLRKKQVGPEHFMKYDVNEVRANLDIDRSSWGHDTAVFSQELNSYASRRLLMHVHLRVSMSRSRVAQVTSCSLLMRPVQQKIHIADHWAPPRYSDEEFAADSDWSGPPRSPGPEMWPPDWTDDERILDQWWILDPWERNPDDWSLPRPYAYKGMEQIGLRRLVFDIGFERLLLFEGLVIMISSSAPADWHSAKLQLEVVSDMGEERTKLETTVQLHPGALVAWRLGAEQDPLKRPLGRMFALTVKPDQYHGGQHFSWSVRAIELFGDLFELPQTLWPLNPRSSFCFDNDSEARYVRVR